MDDDGDGLAMPAADIFFFGALFFLAGVFLSSIGAGVWILVLVLTAAAGLFAVGFFRKEKRVLKFAFLVFAAILGALYYTWDDLKFLKNANIIFDEKSVFSGIVVSNPVLRSGSQEFKLKLNEPFRGMVLFKTARYPEFGYGDELMISGEIKRPFSESYGRYLSKEKMSGVVIFAEVEKSGSGKGSKIKSALFGFKNNVTASFQKILPPKESALLAGLTLGERGEFSEEFKEAMSKSGTTHLVALSGYNITIIVWAVMGIFIWFLKRRLAFFITVLVILGFVIMTGAEASVVRAATMGILVMLAHEVGRLYDFRNAVILAGLMMVFHNPKVLVFDVGFQLSFLALLGIIYLRPAIIRFFRLSEEPGFLSWRENFVATASAQFMVAPFLISNFDSFSPTSLLANVIVLEFIPVTMALGFMAAAFSWISYYLSLFLGLAAAVLLKFEIFVIEFFADFSLPFGPAAGLWAFLAYYLTVIGFMVYVRRFFRQA